MPSIASEAEVDAVESGMVKMKVGRSMNARDLYRELRRRMLQSDGRSVLPKTLWTRAQLSRRLNLNKDSEVLWSAAFVRTPTVSVQNALFFTHQLDEGLQDTSACLPAKRSES